MSNFTNEVFKETENIRDNAQELKHLSQAFYSTGNRHMGEVLFNMSIELSESAGSIKNSVNCHMTNQFERAQQSSVNMVNAALASIGSEVKL